MIFAAQKQARRKGKKTIFKSRGRERSGADVEHYWSRKKEKPTDFSPIPNTPDGLEYWTPAPTPGDTVTSVTSPQDVLISDDINVEFFRQEHLPSNTEPPKIVEIPDDTEDNAEGNAASSPNDAMSIDMDLEREALREYGLLPNRSPSPSAIAEMFLRAASRSMIASHQSTTLRSLDSPEALRHQEQTLNCGREYFQWWIEKVHRSGRSDWNRTSLAIQKFRDAGFDLVYAARYGQFEYRVEILSLDLIEMLPSVLHQDNPESILVIMDLVQAFAWFEDDISPQVLRFRDKALDQALRLWGKDHPSTLFLKTVSHPHMSFFDVVCALSPGKDLLSIELGHQHVLIDSVVQSLCDVASIRRESTESLQYAKELHQTNLATYQESMTDSDLFSSFVTRQRVISAQMRGGNYDEANEWVEDGFEQLSGFHDEILRDKSRDILLFSLGRLMVERKQIEDALDVFKEVLSLRLRLWGAGDFWTTSAALWTRHTQGLVDQGSSP
jgi:hypothetical protein